MLTNPRPTLALPLLTGSCLRPRCITGFHAVVGWIVHFYREETMSVHLPSIFSLCGMNSPPLSCGVCLAVSPHAMASSSFCVRVGLLYLLPLPVRFVVFGQPLTAALVVRILSLFVSAVVLIFQSLLSSRGL